MNEGQGICNVENTVVFSISDVAVHYELVSEAIQRIIDTVHHINRNNSENERIAIVFPEVAAGSKNLGLLVQLFATRELLEQVMNSEKIQWCFSRKVINNTRILELSEVEATPVCFYRTRKEERQSDGYVRRQNRRYERLVAQGRTDVKKLETSKKKPFVGTHFFNTSKQRQRITFKFKQATEVAEQISVSTYGLANFDVNVGLPVIAVAASTAKAA